ncbi:MAG: right-handed parallel beta-helix repeat-containing protein [Phycisphaerales bacterium]|nr:right-handed parallel beta-helix repeat-containing protein [Phycisphaerales bacterium]
MTFGLAVLAAMPAAAVGDVRYVDDDASPGGDGLTWATAHRHLQDALAAAAASGGVVHELRLGGGTYRPDRGAGIKIGDREATFRLHEGLAVRGGYLGVAAGAGEDPDERDHDMHPSVLTGDLLGDDGADFLRAEENAYQVVTALDVDASAELDGVTVQGGYADGPHFGPSPDSRDQGSGVNVYFATPVLRDCRFIGNWAINHGTVNDHGSAILIGCHFEGNYSESVGPALYIHHDADTLVQACTFTNNRTPGKGGGVYCLSTSAARVTDCTFTGNEAANGGGLYAGEDSTVVVEGCTFTGNIASDRGGGLYNDLTHSTVQGCTFLGNMVTEGIGGGGGGGIWNEGGDPQILGCVFTNNTALERGGGVYNGAHSTALIDGCIFTGNETTEDGGGMSNAESDVTVRGCVFAGNIARNGVLNVGGGMSNYISSPRIIGCVFLDNRVEVGENQGGGGGMYNEGGCPVVVNCVFRDNEAVSDFFAAGGGMYNFSNACPRVSNSLFAGNRAAGAGFAVGGGMYNDFASDAVISNTTFADNTAALQGGGVLSFFSSPQIRNTIVWGNTPDQVLVDGGGVATLLFCDVEGGWAGPGAGNFDADPLFVNPDVDDYHLGPDSPCRDRGHNWAVAGDAGDLDADGDLGELTPLDIEGLPRFADTAAGDPGCGAGAIVDLGPYEASGVTVDVIRGDLDGDGLVGFADLITLIATWGPCPPDACCLADLDLDDAIGFADLLTLLSNWG